MSAKSKKSVLDPARPFDAALWAQAEAIARRYQFISWYDEDEKAHFGKCVEYPEAMSHGDTPAERDAMVMEAATLGIATMLEHGERPPLTALSAI